jgi:hypothetical protein
MDLPHAKYQFHKKKLGSHIAFDSAKYFPRFRVTVSLKKLNPYSAVWRHLFGTQTTLIKV